MKRLELDQAGQTAVEYLLLFFVMSSIAFGIMQFVNSKIGLTADNCPPDSISPICYVKNAIEGGGGQPFQRFSIIGAN